MKFAICNEIFQGWEIGDAMRFAADAGYHGIELAPFTLARTVTEISAPQRGRIRESAERAGLEICGLHWLLAKTEGFHLTHSDPAVRERTAQYLCELANCCADLGGKVLVLGSPQQRNVAADVSMEQARAWAAETLAPGLKTAEDRHVLWCIEPLAPGETNFLNTAAEAIEFARQLNSPAARIILDVKAMAAERTPITDVIRASWPHFAHFHANDPNRKGPGFGAMDFRPIVGALKSVGYDGFVSVEVFNFEEGAATIATQSLLCLRAAFA